jgi:hypothetical protein
VRERSSSALGTSLRRSLANGRRVVVSCRAFSALMQPLKIARSSSTGSRGQRRSVLDYGNGTQADRRSASESHRTPIHLDGRLDFRSPGPGCSRAQEFGRKTVRIDCRNKTGVNPRCPRSVRSPFGIRKTPEAAR